MSINKKAISAAKFVQKLLICLLVKKFGPEMTDFGPKFDPQNHYNHGNRAIYVMVLSNRSTQPIQLPSMKETEDQLQNEFGTVYQNVGHKTMMALYQNFLKYQTAAFFYIIFCVKIGQNSPLYRFSYSALNLKSNGISHEYVFFKIKFCIFSAIFQTYQPFFSKIEKK